MVRRTQNLSISEDRSQSKSDKRESDTCSRHSKYKPKAKTEYNLEDHEDLQQKLDELTALKSIFDENILTVDEKELKGRFLAEPVLNANKLTIVYKLVEQKKTKNNRSKQRTNDRTSRKFSCDNQIQEFVVQHLPPIELYFELSRRYPSKLNPLFLISCKWLTRSQLGMY